MGGKRNKIRYQSKPRDKVQIALTGQVWLRYADDEESIAKAARGDLLLFPENEALNTTRLGEYGGTGFAGYFRVDVSDGREWRAVILTSLFPGREHYFARHERPADRYALCAEMLRALAGRKLTRTYREHYELDGEDS